jgi:NitT/TauT family transport system ATP-binding protein
MGARLTIENVKKTYGREANSVLALDGVSLDVRPGEFVSLLGPSGCGKSTLLYIVGGFEAPSSGSVQVNDTPVASPGADRGMVFQDYALFPWRTVRQNIIFGPMQKGRSRADCLSQAEHLIQMVGLAKFGDRYPHELSGGMRQRCALARSLANEPKVLLMDEPLSAIDAMTRTTLQDEIRRLCSSEADPKTVLYVTHAIDEAVFLSDRVVMLAPRPGRIMGIIDVPFGRERNDDTRANPEFHALVDNIWQTMKAYATG